MMRHNCRIARYVRIGSYVILVDFDQLYNAFLLETLVDRYQETVVYQTDPAKYNLITQGSTPRKSAVLPAALSKAYSPDDLTSCSIIRACVAGTMSLLASFVFSASNTALACGNRASSLTREAVVSTVRKFLVNSSATYSKQNGG